MDFNEYLDGFLERNSLIDEQLERKYGPEEERRPVDWDKLFPSKKDKKKRRDDEWRIKDQNFLGELENALNEDPNPERWWPEDGWRGKSKWETCAWYQPIHYYRMDWGIYIREDCMRKQALHIASYLKRTGDTSFRSMSRQDLGKMVIRASFLAFFLHEHFHHKTESFAFRVLVASNHPVYRRYFKGVYQYTYMTEYCLEEALANADAYYRIMTSPYRQNIGDVGAEAARLYMEDSFKYEPPGYAQALDYIYDPDVFKVGLNRLQGQIKEGRLYPARPDEDWEYAPQMLRSMRTCKSDIYTIVRSGYSGILP